MCRTLSALPSADRLQGWSGRNGLAQWRCIRPHPLAPGLSWYTYIYHTMYVRTRPLARTHTHSTHT